MRIPARANPGVFARLTKKDHGFFHGLFFSHKSHPRIYFIYDFALRFLVVPVAAFPFFPFFKTASGM